MRERKFPYDFDPTPAQRATFRGTPYERDEHELRSTILARGLTGDPSAGKLTPRQQQWVQWLRPQLEER